ncbi:hypothetical protein EDB19DRAFT_2032627 [Suillus lakei]|nr:hypothetical protein EDB19DRAFT_2032627 [Suillus lakei]
MIESFDMGDFESSRLASGQTRGFRYSICCSVEFAFGKGDYSLDKFNCTRCMRSYPIIKSDNASRAVSESLGDWPMNNSQMCSTRTGEAHLTPGHSREMCSGHLGALRLDRTILHRKKAAFGESLTRRKETGKPHEQRQHSS